MYAGVGLGVGEIGGQNVNVTIHVILSPVPETNLMAYGEEGGHSPKNSKQNIYIYSFKRHQSTRITLSPCKRNSNRYV